MHVHSSHKQLSERGEVLMSWLRPKVPDPKTRAEMHAHCSGDSNSSLSKIVWSLATWHYFRRPQLMRASR